MIFLPQQLNFEQLILGYNELMQLHERTDTTNAVPWCNIREFLFNYIVTVILRGTQSKFMAQQMQFPDATSRNYCLIMLLQLYI